MFGKIKWLTLILPVLFLMTCTIGDDLESKKDPSTVTVTFNANGGSGSPPAAQTENIGASITLPNANSLSKENHTFGGWNTNAGGTGINYPAGESFTLPNTDITMYAKWDNVPVKTEKRETKTFDSSTNWSLPGYVTYPATVEVYALGAGGGGQGGHRFEKWWVGDTNFTGTGAQGGGGAAAYTKFSVDNSIEFTVTVGRGGDGGSARFRKASITDNSWLSGMPGNSGGNTSVNVVGNITGVTTITAGGGSGGTGGGGNSTASGGAASAGNAGTGGSGGSATGPNPNAGNSIAESLYVNGSSGRNGSINGTTISNDNAASINLGSFGRGTAGRGGSGGYGDTQAGGKGGDGRVIIVVTWD